MGLRFSVLSIPIALAACGGDGTAAFSVLQNRCEDAVARAVAPGASDARLSALASLKYEIQDLKGFLLRYGFNGVRARAPRVACGPYQLALGLKACVATAQLCER